MARRKNQPEAVQLKFSLAERLRLIRVELYGERGGSEMARQLSLPVRTWYNYEAGVTVPAEILLRFVELTSVEPAWLLHGRSPQYREKVALPDPPAETSVQALLRSALSKLEQDDLRRGGPAGASRAPVGDPVSADDRVQFLDESAAGLKFLDASSGARLSTAQAAWGDAVRDHRVVAIDGHDMAPIVAQAATVAYSAEEFDGATLDGKLVVAWVDGVAQVRWLRVSGRYFLLYAENPSAEPGTMLLDSKTSKVRRIIGIRNPA